MILGKGTAKMLGGQLGNAVGRSGPRRQCFVARAVLAVDGRGRGIEEAAQRWGGSANALQEALDGLDIAGVVKVEVGPTFDQPRHCGQVKDHFSSGERSIQMVLAEIEVMKLEPGVVFGNGESALLDLLRIVRHA